MRNLTVYPVTAPEAISAVQLALESYTRDIDKMGVGNIDGVALLMVEKFIEANKEKFDTFAKASLEVIFEVKE